MAKIIRVMLQYLEETGEGKENHVKPMTTETGCGKKCGYYYRIKKAEDW